LSTRRRAPLLTFPIVLMLTLGVAATARADCDSPLESGTTPQWRRWEKSLPSEEDYLAGNRNPSRDIELSVTFTECKVGKRITYTSRGFWHGPGGHDFRIRGAFPPGIWEWKITGCKTRNAQNATPDCSGDDGFRNKAGRFEVVPDLTTDNPLYANGYLRSVNPKNATPSLVFDNGTPFFWLGDTVWNANVAMNTTNEWDSLLTARTNEVDPFKRFSVLQMGFAPRPAVGQHTSKNPFVHIGGSCSASNDGPNKCYRFNPAFWQDLDEKVRKANEAGIVVVLAGFIDPLTDTPDNVMIDETEAKFFAEAVTARMLGNFVIFSPGFDHRPLVNASIIDTVGKAIQAVDMRRHPDNPARSIHLITNHVAGATGFTHYRDYVHKKLWLNFELFQSGTPRKKPPTVPCEEPDGAGSDAFELRNMTERAICLPSKLSTFKFQQKLKSAINGETVYPGAEPLANHTPYRARQTAYYSMLSGAQGYSMGVCGVLDLNLTDFAGCKTNWNRSLGVPKTVDSTKVLRSVFQTLPVSWLKLKPQSWRVEGQLSGHDRQIALAYDASSTMLAYVPNDVGSIKVWFKNVAGLANSDKFKEPWTATWINPRTGLDPKPGGRPNAAPGELGKFTFTKPEGIGAANCEQYETAGTPDCKDWLLLITKGAAAQPPPPGQQMQVITVAKAQQGSRMTSQITDAVGNILAEHVLSDGASTPFAPKVATAASGSSMVVWQAGFGSSARIYGMILNAQGAPASGQLEIATGRAAMPGHPAVAVLAGGDFLVAWAGTATNRYGPWIRTRQYGPAGQDRGPAKFAVACNFVEGDYPQVAGDPNGGYVLAWEMLDGNGIYVFKNDENNNKSDARLVENTGSIAVLETLTVTAASAIMVDYGLYADDGTPGGNSSAAVTTLQCNVPVLALGDAFATESGKAITIAYRELLENDGPDVTFFQSDSKCVPNTDGRGCTYTPPFGFTGDDTFSYTVKNGANQSGSATVTITVAPPLTANPDSFTMEGDSSLQITSTQLLINDSAGAVFGGVQNAVNGNVTCTEGSPATCTFTPNAGFRGTATFQYLISRDGNPPYTIGTVSISVTQPSAFQIIPRCTDGVCVFTAIAPNANAVRSYIWRIGNGASFAAAYKIGHRFGASGTYRVSVTVTYNFGLPQQQGFVDVPITYAIAAEWDTEINGLGVELDNFRFFNQWPTGTTPAVNWSPNPGDCTDPSRGCGDHYLGPDNSCDLQNCRLYNSFTHTGVFEGTLRIQKVVHNPHPTVEVIYKEYPVVFEAVNQYPSPRFTVSRPDPNVRNFSFTSVDGGDDGPFPLIFAWDFGDGSQDSGQEDKTHFYSSVGTYNAKLIVTDGDGQTGEYEQAINVVNANPVPRITVNCSGFDCELGAESSTDDGSNINSWSWTFGDGQSGSGPRVIHHYAAGCYIVTLTVTDGDGGIASTTVTVVAGPPLVATNTKVVVDAHVQSYSVAGSGWATTNGNLNGILEPGETVVVEPTWPIAASTQPLPVSASGISPPSSLYGFLDTAPWYDLSAGVSDCWTLGHCYAVFVLSQHAQTRPVHSDIQFNETNLATGQLTPGSPVTIHVGKSFSDVATTHWSYAGIESVLHAGVDSGCGGTQFCPGAVVTRGEVARWLMKAKYGASYQPPACSAAPFTDVPCSHPYAAWIAQLKADGITAGTGDGTYGPDQALNRAEAAVFLLRTKMGAGYVPPACSPDFGDVACNGTPYWAAAWISDVKARGISSGCDLTEFCPGNAVDRAQAAALFAKTFGLRIDKTQCPIVTNNGYDLVPTHVDLPSIVDITFNPNPAVVGGPSTATLTIGDPPPVSTSVPLSIDNPAASVPPSVTVPALATSVTFAVTPANITVRTTTRISATYLGQTKTVALDICTPPPAITAHPASRIINNGQSTTLSVTASGGGGLLSYQWYQGNAPSTATPVPGATGSSLTVTPNATTSYWVRVSATCGSANSTTAIVTVCNPPLIPGPPLNDVVVIGNTATLTVSATGSEPLTYQWYEGASGTTTTPVGTNAPTFTTPAVNVPRSYWVRVTSTCNGVQTADSPTATVTPVTQITRRQLAANTVNSLTSINTKWTRPTQPGSLLVAVMSSSHVGAVGAFGVPAGWQQAAGYEFNHVKTTIYYYPNNPGGRISETITTAGFRESVLQLIEYVGATNAPLDVTAFDGDHQPRNGEVSTGTTPPWMAQPKAVVVSALSTNTLANFAGQTNSFVELDERSVYESLTAAVHERMVNALGTYGHLAAAPTAGEWVGMVAVFKSINDCTLPPSITAHPLSSTINAGQQASLSVAATGGGLTYQWYQGASGTTTNPVIGANASTLPITPPATAGYWVRVTNACGVANSNAATITVCSPLGIATHPLSQSVTSGFAATLSVTPSGSGPFSYQWFEGPSGTTTTPVTGATGATYTTPPLTASKSYWVRVTSTCNGSASASSDAAVLTVSSANQIARRQLAANTANSQTSITTSWIQPTQAGSLLVAVLSAQHGAVVGNFTPPAGWQLATSYEMANLKSAIYYYPNHPGGRTSETFGVAGFRELVLQLLEYTGATASPLDKVAFSGDMAVNNGFVSTGTTLATAQAREVVVTALTIMAQSSFTNPANGFVKLDERNVYNDITAAVHERIVTTAGAYGHSADVSANTQWVGLVATFKSLDLCSAPPSITTQPASRSVNSGQTATLSLTATTSGGTLSYQWYEGASGVTTTPVGTNSPTFTTPALAATKSYWVRVSNECGNVASNAATVTVCVPPGIGAHPAAATINSGQTATLTVTATGSGPFSYQWYEGASGVTATPAGTNSASFTTPALTATKTYWVRVTSTCNGSASVNSNAATVTVCAPAGIAAQPASTAINSGQTATLSVVAGGSGPFSYQWYEGASGVTTTPVGTSSASFTTPALTATKTYWVRVTSTCNGTTSVNSAAATVTVCNATGISAHPASQTINSGATATLTVAATGSGPFTYQWYEGASGVTTTPAGTNSASFTTPALSATKTYWVRVTGGCGSANSNAAAVTVCTPPGIAAHPASQTISSGASATLTVAASGSGPFSYQWYEGPSGTTAIPVGANSPSFTTPALTATKSYWVRVTSTCNGTASANSNAATITVNTPVLARRQFAASTANSQLTITTNWTQPTQAGNLLVAIVSAERSWYPIANWQPPAGWQLAVSYEMTNIKTSIYYYPNNPGGRTAETFANGGFYDDMILQLAEYTGVSTIAPLDRTAFNGNSSNDGFVETGYTPQTTQAKELVITALTAYATAEFYGPSQGFVELDDRNQGFGRLTTAVHERIVTTVNQYGHYAQVTDPAEWVGVVATFKAQ
jgi:Protein of unknown function (DUF4038)/PKD domain/Ig-like domain CHU_C associated/Bacterial Ig domain/S-layer homology domain